LGVTEQLNKHLDFFKEKAREFIIASFVSSSRDQNSLISEGIQMELTPIMTPTKPKSRFGLFSSQIRRNIFT
jgi:hypothetical protein